MNEATGRENNLNIKTNVRSKKLREPPHPSLYKAYLLTIIGNNEHSLMKACSLLIGNKQSFNLEEKNVAVTQEFLSIRFIPATAQEARYEYPANSSLYT